MSTLELVKLETRAGTYKRREINLPTYAVILDGETIGRVARSLLTRERRTKGNRYVDARWQSPGWRISDPNGRHPIEVMSRRDGIERLIAQSGRGWGEAADLAASVAAVR